jgi:magnesium-transporting ATPase (P-type)
VLNYREKIRSDLQEKELSFCDVPDYNYDEITKEKKGYIDELSLTEQMSKKYKGSSNSLTIETDVKSISGISRLRGDHVCASLEQCRHIFITHNSAIIESVEDLKLEEFALCMLEYDLTAMLWLKTPNKISDLPSEILARLSYAACRPSKEWVEAYIKNVEDLKNCSEFTDEYALSYRGDHKIVKEILKISGNDSNGLRKEVILDYSKQKYDEGYKKGQQDYQEKIEKDKQTRINSIKEESEEKFEPVKRVTKIVFSLFLFVIAGITVTSFILTYVNNGEKSIILFITLLIEIVLIIVEFLFNKLKHIDKLSNKITRWHCDKHFEKKRKLFLANQEY